MNLDDKLREMARDDQVPLPDGYDEMLSQLYASLASDQGESPEGKETRQMKHGNSSWSGCWPWRRCWP